MSSDGNKEQPNGGAQAYSNDLIIDQGFPALNTFRSTQPHQKQKQGEPEEDTLTLPNFSFVSFPSALKINKEQEENIIHDCDLTFTARTKEDSDAYSSGTTFFIPASMKPRCALEELALTIFQTYTKGLVSGKHFDVERSGAEWWTLVLDTTSENGTTGGDKGNNIEEEEEEEEEEEDDEVGMHFDADYGLEAQLPNYMIHPRVATVTYLSSKGVPTFIMNKKSPPPSDEEKASLNGSIDKGWISCPMLGKHIGFDGRFLHGAIGTFMPKGLPQTKICCNDNDERVAKRRKVGEGNNGEIKDTEKSDCKRITFMVNVWINHCPIDAELIDDSLCSRMKTYWENDSITSNGSRLKGDSKYEKPLNWSLDSVQKPNTDLFVKELSLPKRKSQSDDGITEAIDSVICNREVTINFRSSEEELNDVAITAHECKGKSLEVRFQDKVLDLEVGAVAKDSDDEDEE
mmetsp:Transcript_6137/g.9276  ORF Transcript_6137/g.9276 Transcript_6137/m.9276 type:complete len:460 (+) Transcript_6137:66-1445(+)